MDNIRFEKTKSFYVWTAIALLLPLGAAFFNVFAAAEVELPVTAETSGSANLSVSKAVSVETANPGTTVQFTVLISNLGSVQATNVKLQDTLPQHLTFADTGSQVRNWDVGTIDAGGSKTIQYSVNIAGEAPGGNYVNDAKVTADSHAQVATSRGFDVVAGDVAGEEAKPALSVVKSASIAQVNPGSSLVYTISITNTGDAPALNIRAVDSLPPGFTTQDNQTTREFTKARLEPSEKMQVNFTANVPQGTAPGNYTNIVRVNADILEEVEARHTLQVLEGKVLGATGIGPGMWAVLLAASGLVIAGAMHLRNQSAYSTK